MKKRLIESVEEIQTKGKFALEVFLLN